jgi:hypothetical protein
MVWDRNRWRRVECARSGTVQRDGEWYCWQHDPVVIKEREDDREAKSQASRAKEKEEWRRKRAMNQVCYGVSTDDLEKFAPGDLAALLAKEANDG